MAKRCQGLVPRLLAELEAAFPAGSIYTPLDHGARSAWDWPSMDELADAGKHVIVASAADYGEVRRCTSVAGAVHAERSCVLIHVKGQEYIYSNMCGWRCARSRIRCAVRLVADVSLGAPPGSAATDVLGLLSVCLLCLFHFSIERTT